MAKKDKVTKIKKYIDDILGTKSSLRNKLPSKKLLEKQLFCEILQNLQFVNSRTMGMKHDYKINFMDYDDPFYVVIENLLKLSFSKEQQNIINCVIWVVHYFHKLVLYSIFCLKISILLVQINPMIIKVLRVFFVFFL